jgi:hypothetical protein
VEKDQRCSVESYTDMAPGSETIMFPVFNIKLAILTHWYAIQ